MNNEEFVVLKVSAPDGDVQTNAEHDIGETKPDSPQRESDGEINVENYDETPKQFRSIRDIYSNTEEVELDNELMMIAVEEPKNYEQAVKEQEWRLAMKNEIDSIEQNGTWELTELPAGHKVIGLKWIYKLKKNAEGKVVKQKTILVARGFVQNMA